MHRNVWSNRNLKPKFVFISGMNEVSPDRYLLVVGVWLGGWVGEWLGHHGYELVVEGRL
jgi:hypothetical protein